MPTNLPDPADLPEVPIYTDGACDPNPGPGGWAAVLRSGGHEKRLTGSDPDTTNNRMELQAVIAALAALKRPSRIRLHTDSEYVRRGVTEWLERWKAKGWKNVANRDLWEALDEAQRRHVIEWRWVKGHAGDPLNEEVDRLAVSMIPRQTLPLDDRAATHVFTGVSCRGTQGAWAALLRRYNPDEPSVETLSGDEPETSANRLHLLAALNGLRATPAGSRVHLYTPSDYVIKGIQQWVRAWAAQGWRTREGQPTKHRELWQSLQAEAAMRQVHWHSVRGEARPPESQQAEVLAQQRARPLAESEKPG
jgi:ribonuclease HI